MNPWDRDEVDLMMEDPWEEEQLGPPEEEQPDPPEAGEVEEPTAPIHDTSSAPTDTAAAAPVVALVLPVSEELSDTTKRPRPVEPTAPTDAPLLAEVLESPPKLRRLQSKTFVPQYVCPTKTDFRVAWDKKSKSKRIGGRGPSGIRSTDDNDTIGYTGRSEGSTPSNFTRWSWTRHRGKTSIISVARRSSRQGDVLSKSWIRMSEERLCRSGWKAALLRSTSPSSWRSRS